MVGITVIIPSVGRPSLAATLRSVSDQTNPRHDFVCVVEDSEFDQGSMGLVNLFGNGPTWSVNVGRAAPLGAFGHGARNWFLDAWAKDREGYLYSIDDDDILLPGAMDAMRAAIEEHPGHWFIFQMRGGANSRYHGLIVPHMGHNLMLGNLGTPCILWPASAKARWGVSNVNGWGEGYAGDYEMAVALQEELGDPVWIDTVIAEVRP